MFAATTLTDEQRAAAAHEGGHLLVVAGAGTGKTTALTARLVHLVDRGVDPGRILLLTFSRRAAAELLHRAEQAAGPAAGRVTWGGTFHAVANRLLRRHGAALGLDASFTVLDQADGADLLALVRDELRDGTTPARRTARKDTMAAILSRVVNTRVALSVVLARHYPWCTDERDELRDTFAAYTRRKRSHQVLDYDDLLLCWHALLESPAAAPAITTCFDHVLVDEYQDTNALQADILERLAAGGACITAVGDDGQAIYSFRAATQRNILEFPQRFGADVVLLTENHRSTPPILATANAVLREAADRHPKELWSTRPTGPRPELVSCADEAAQSTAVCSRILEQLDAGVPLRAQAVLFRAGHHSDLLELELAARRIPYIKYGGLKFLEAAHVKDLVALLRLVENPRDELAWFRVLQLLDGVGAATARRITGALGLASVDAPLAPVTALAALPGLPPGVDALAAALGDAAGPALRARPGAQVERVREWLDPLLARRYRGLAARIADLEQLTRAAEAAPSLERFLVDLALDPPASTGDLAGPPHLDDDVLTLSTIHSAKGCEWDVVHLLHVTDGNIPSDMACGDDEGVEEERRLLYVAVTRARDRLHCHVPLRYHHRPRGRDDAHSYAQPSRFLSAAVLATFDRASHGHPLAEPDVTAGGAGTGGTSGLVAVDAALAALWEA
jgi:DNA helicase II / ATP-dependent DNA helicase PcrA